MSTFLMNRFNVDPFMGNTMFKIKYLNDWCKRLNTAATTKDSRTITELKESMLSPDEHKNPIKLATNIDYEYVIHDIVRALKQVDGLDSRTIARLLVRSGCPIRNVISQQSIDIVEHMIQLGSAVNEAPDNQSIWRTTALHSAVAGGDSHLRAVELLLDNGADLHCLDSLGFTPLHRCLEARQCVEVLRLLVTRGARGDTHDISRTSALVIAIRNQHPLEAVQLLVQGGADVRERDVNGLAPLHYAGRELRRDLVDYLLDLGVDPNTRSLDGESVLFYAFSKASIEFLRYLVLVCGVDLNARTGSDCTLLHVVYSTYFGARNSNKRAHTAIADKIRFCLLRGADVNGSATGNYKTTVLEQAIDLDNWLDVLLEQMAIREFLDLPVSEHNASMVYNNDFCLSYINVCKIELVALMDLRFYNDVTLFNMLTDSEAKMMAYVRNEDLVVAFRKICQMQLFLIYSPALVERFNHCLYLHKMRQKAVKVLSSALLGVTSYVAVQEIAERLSNRDLFKLSKFYRE